MSCGKQALPSSFWSVYCESPVLLTLYPSFVFINDTQILHVNPGYLKFIIGMNSSPDNENLFTISLILYLVLTCLILLKGILLKGLFIPKLLNNQLASW